MALTVYEAVNRTLKEVLVGVTAEPLVALKDKHAAEKLPELAAWDFAAHEIEYREVEAGVPERDAPTFLDGYARSIRRAGWVMKVSREGWIVRRDA